MRGISGKEQQGGFAFRKPAKEDAGQIALALQQNYNFSSQKEAKEFFQRDIAEGMNYIIAEQNNKIAGLATWRMHDVPKHQLAELHKIAVLDEFKGKGLSQKIFQELVKDMQDFYNSRGQKLRKLYVMGHANNERAMKFYKKLGFKKEAVLPNHYYAGIDEIVLSMFFK